MSQQAGGNMGLEMLCKWWNYLLHGSHGSKDGHNYKEQ
jgi:hypothetical protein